MTVVLVRNLISPKVAAIISQVLAENNAAKNKLKKLQKCQGMFNGVKIT